MRNVSVHEVSAAPRGGHHPYPAEISCSRDALRRPATLSWGADYQAGYAYDNSSRLASVTAFGRSAAYTRMAGTNLPTSTVFRNGETAVHTASRSYDDFNRLTGISGYGYTLNSRDERTRLTLTDGSAWDYTYDGIGQVTGGIKTDAAEVPLASHAYTYDQIGNRVTSSSGLTVIQYTANLLNQYTAVGAETPTYDDDGNMLTNGDWSYSWNTENRLIAAESATAKLEFAYDYLGRRSLRKKVKGNLMKYFCIILLTVGICFSGCSHTLFRKTYEVWVAPGKKILVYALNKNIFLEWQGNKVGFAPPEREHVLGLAADEQNRLFVFTQRTGFDPVQAGCLQDGRFYQIALNDIPRDLFTANLDPYIRRHPGRLLDVPLGYLLAGIYSAPNRQPIFPVISVDTIELWEARYPSPRVGEDSVSLLKSQYREVDLPWPDWIETITPESFAVWGDENPTPESKLYWLTSTDLVGQAEKLLEAKVDVDCRTPGGRTPLMNAAYHNNLEMMSLLLDHGANLEAENFNGETALYYAIYGHSYDAVHFLSFEMSDIHHQNRFRENVLMTAIMADPEIALSIFVCERTWGYGPHKPLRRVKWGEWKRYLEFSENQRPWQEMHLVRQTNLANETFFHYLGRNFERKPELFHLLEYALRCEPSPRPRCNYEQRDYAGKTALYYFLRYYSSGFYENEGYCLKALKMMKELGVDFSCLKEETDLLELIQYSVYKKELYEFLMEALNQE